MKSLLERQVALMTNFWTVVNFTMRNKLKTKSFLITTLILVLLLTIGANIPYIITKIGGDEEAASVGYIQGNEAAVTDSLKAYFDAAPNSEIAMVSFPDAGTAEANEQAMKQAIKDEKIKGYIVLTPDEAAGFPKILYKSEELFDNNTTGELSNALRSIKLDIVAADSGLTDEQKQLLFSPVTIGTEQISLNNETADGKTPEQRGLAMGFVYAMMILLFMGIFVTSQLIATEITAEKSSRVMEILVTSVAPLTQMFGKIFGMFLVGLIQISVYVLVLVINLNLPHNQELLQGININFGDLDPMLYVYGIVFYLTGYFLYATLCAATGSIVSRTEDLGQAVMPVMMLAMAGFYIGIFSISAPGTTLVKVASFIPFFSPFAMTLRLGLTDPAWWEVLLSIGLLVIAIFVFGWLSAKIYRTGVLMYGKRPSLKELMKAMKAYKV